MSFEGAKKAAKKVAIEGVKWAGLGAVLVGLPTAAYKSAKQTEMPGTISGEQKPGKKPEASTEATAPKKESAESVSISDQISTNPEDKKFKLTIGVKAPEKAAEVIISVPTPGAAEKKEEFSPDSKKEIKSVPAPNAPEIEFVPAPVETRNVPESNIESVPAPLSTEKANQTESVPGFPPVTRSPGVDSVPAPIGPIIKETDRMVPEHSKEIKKPEEDSSELSAAELKEMERLLKKRAQEEGGN